MTVLLLLLLLAVLEELGITYMEYEIDVKNYLHIREYFRCIVLDNPNLQASRQDGWEQETSWMKVKE